MINPKMKTEGTHSRFVFRASNVAVVVLLGLMNVLLVTDLGPTRFAEQGRIHFRQGILRVYNNLESLLGFQNKFNNCVAFESVF